jgi:hypothetical protein
LIWAFRLCHRESREFMKARELDSRLRGNDENG